MNWKIKQMKKEKKFFKLINNFLNKKTQLRIKIFKFKK